MPGSSLWLLPPIGHPLNDLLPTLIDQTSSHFNSPHRFLPHVTLTSDISPSLYSQDAQAWLNSLQLPTKSDISVQFEALGSEDVFFRKLYIKCEKNDGIKQLGKMCRTFVKGFEENEAAHEWVETSYTPHLSLLYHDCPQVDADGLLVVERLAKDVGIAFQGEITPNTWEGGRVVLVPTDKPINQWNPIAERSL
ncbi:2',3'-cyclic-nucleotide 3'-phosphodiesterase [Pyrenochaeta sp. DS3sAY3a]|nr:2',3'-cyclic-nucleotide 3'-phosphodiesterase [Pyrenochaeta sp. DS3sAY3a]